MLVENILFSEFSHVLEDIDQLLFLYVKTKTTKVNFKIKCIV